MRDLRAASDALCFPHLPAGSSLLVTQEDGQHAFPKYYSSRIQGFRGQQEANVLELLHEFASFLHSKTPWCVPSCLGNRRALCS